MDEVGRIMPDLLEQTAIMLQMVGLAMLFVGVAGLIIGTALYVTRKGGILAQPIVFWVLNVVLNTFRPIPFIIFLAALQPLARVGVGKGIGTEAATF